MEMERLICVTISLSFSKQIDIHPPLQEFPLAVKSWDAFFPSPTLCKMPGMASVLDRNCRTLHSEFPSPFHRQENDADGSSVLSEIQINSLASGTAFITSERFHLKRKRPPVIQVPPSARLVQAFQTHEGEGVGFDGAGFGVFCQKGKRKSMMEDAHKIVSQLTGGSKKGFFGVYDGHGGRKASEFVAQNLHKNMLKMVGSCEQHEGKEEAIKDSYQKTDHEFLKQGLTGGACCVTALIEEGDLIVSNLGDCRAVLSRDGVAEPLTVDHKVGQEDERNRIEEKGGFVDIYQGIWRVQGTLAVSRSIGDVHLKEWVTAEPDIRTLPLTSDMELLILATDGLWDKVGNQEAIDTAVHFHSDMEKTGNEDGYYCKGIQDEFGSQNAGPPCKARKTTSSFQPRLSFLSTSQENGFKSRLDPGRLLAACKELVTLATIRGSSDDITVMIIDLKDFYCNQI